ncbi:hypothetical protein F7725_011288 [Dissostichus mawsoni]|uniref:Uncharacterized protein n=1 Tax=Dissostichus mawsoni TaxID=36200 RepID=A0A7J5ZBN9_DISMA|nr:hypothetical protein F7725_011288 [Dissostichus mawsoni]
MEIPWDSEHVVSPATRRQRQMAWVPAVGMSVIPQREREGKRARRGRAPHSQAERRECAQFCFSHNLWFAREEAAAQIQRRYLGTCMEPHLMREPRFGASYSRESLPESLEKEHDRSNSDMREAEEDMSDREEEEERESEQDDNGLPKKRGPRKKEAR